MVIRKRVVFLKYWEKGDFMDIEKNTTYVCRVVRINDEEVDYISSLVVNEEFITRIAIKEVERQVLDRVKNETLVNIVVRYETQYITIVQCQLVNRSYKMGSDYKESKVNLEYMSSLMLLDYLWNPPQELHFSGINCEITETTELLGVYPYQINYDELTFPKVECDIKGEVVSKMVGHGFSYFVTPEIMQEDGELHISMYGRIQYSGGKDRNLSEIYELLDSICLFFEIISGEIITIEDVYLTHGEHSIKTVGLCNFPKNKLNALRSNFDTRSYLRKGLFKISDFEESIGSAIAVFYKIQNECMLACEAYKQILLDEEIKISTYNKFLKVMQVVEGFQRTKIDENEEVEFNNKKNEIMEKLDETDKEFVKKYTFYNGQNFRKCMNEFTLGSIQIISGLSKNKAKEASEKIIGKIINDRDVYTHASKEVKPILTIDELQAVNYCYKTFFRVVVLSKMGLSEKIIRKRLLFDRKFVAYFQRLFELKIKKEDKYHDTGEFDQMMW